MTSEFWIVLNNQYYTKNTAAFDELKIYCLPQAVASLQWLSELTRPSTNHYCNWLLVKLRLSVVSFFLCLMKNNLIHCFSSMLVSILFMKGQGLNTFDKADSLFKGIFRVRNISFWCVLSKRIKICLFFIDIHYTIYGIYSYRYWLLCLCLSSWTIPQLSIIII